MCFALNYNVRKNLLHDYQDKAMIDSAKKEKDGRKPDNYLEVPENCVLHEKFPAYLELVWVLIESPKLIFFLVQNVKEHIYWLHMAHIFMEYASVHVLFLFKL